MNILILLVPALLLEIVGAFLLARGSILGYKNHVAKELKLMSIKSAQLFRNEAHERNERLLGLYTRERVDEFNSKSDGLYDSMVEKDRSDIETIDSNHNYLNFKSGGVGLTLIVLAFILQCICIWLNR